MKSDDIDKALEKGAEVTWLLKDDQEMASKSWSHFLASHNLYTAEDGEWRTALDTLRLSGRLVPILDAFFRDTVMACLRLVDSGKKAGSLVKIHKILLNDSVQERLRIYFDSLPASNKDQVNQKIQRLQSFFLETDADKNNDPHFWHRNPIDPELKELRADFILLRDKPIAHREVHTGQYPHARLEKFARLNEDFVCISAWLFQVPYTYALEGHQEEAEDFWSYAMKGFVE